MIAIFKREVKSYFINMTGYVFLGVMLVFAGIYTTAINLIGLSSSFEYVLSNMTIVLMIVIPISSTTYVMKWVCRLKVSHQWILPLPGASCL